MKKLLIISTLFANLLAMDAAAAPRDIIGGADGSTQTIAHCGFLPTSIRHYTGSPTSVRIIQQKLAGLGYYRAYPHGQYDRASKAAVKKFQKEYGLTADGVVGPATAQRLAYETHPNPNVRRCFRTADVRFR